MPDIYIADKNKAKDKKATDKAGHLPHRPYRAYKARIEKIIKPEFRNRSQWASFVAEPKNLRFETQERKEKIILLMRRHFVTNISWVVTAAVSSLIPILIIGYFPLDFLPFRYRLVAVMIWYLMTFAYAFEKFLTWFFNVNIITDERIVDIDFPSILYKDISETKIDRIEDVSIKVGGFARSLFNFGNVIVQTAGAQQEIGFEAVPNPDKVSRVLSELILEEEQEKLEGRVR